MQHYFSHIVGSVFGPIRFLLPVCQTLLIFIYIEHICSLIPSLFGKQEVGIWRVKKRFPQYGVPIWSLWPNIRFLPSIVAEKNATKNGVQIKCCSECKRGYLRMYFDCFSLVQKQCFSECKRDYLRIYFDCFNLVQIKCFSKCKRGYLRIYCTRLKQSKYILR
jgi:hypothetical protein